MTKISAVDVIRGITPDIGKDESHNDPYHHK